MRKSKIFLATRREALCAAGALLAIQSNEALAAGSPRTRSDAALELTTTPDEAVVQTASGKVRGFKRGSTFIFRGVPYGADTGEAARFMSPQPPQSWSGIRQTLTFGPVCPTPFPPRTSEELSFMTDWTYGYPGEDCLRLNIWSTSVGAASKLPVMVWLHGGGFIGGNAQDIPAYDGAALARRGVVVVTVNHRLGPLGFMDLSEIGGERYATSGNAGLLDLVLALEWVRANIANFGGDPARVTIFGHSGGGGKVSSLMGMPSAKGLFSGAIVMSGSRMPASPQGQARAMTRALFAQLGLQTSDLGALNSIPAQRLIESGFAASAGMSRNGATMPLGGWSPVADGNVLAESWLERAPTISAHVPMIIGSVRDEIRAVSLPGNEAELQALAERIKPDKGKAVAAALRRAYPNLPSSDLGAILGGMGNGTGRLAAVNQARMQTATGASVYSYWFTWVAPLFGGRQGVPHGCDLAEAFDNVAYYDQMTGNSPEAHRIASLISQAFVNFATTRNPSQPKLAWPAFDSENLSTMVFDRETRVVNDPLGEVRRLLG